VAEGISVGSAGSDRLRLEVTAGNAAGTEIEIGDEFLIGRHAPEEGKLANDPEISRRHARISRAAEGGYVLEDVGSMNGTFLNGHRISGPEALGVGDKIEVGHTTLVVQDGAPQPPPADEVPRPKRLPSTKVSASRPDGADSPTPEAPPSAHPAPAQVPEPVAPPEAPAPAPAPEPVAPPEPPAPEPVAPLEPAAPAPAAPPRLSLRLEIDFESGEAVLELDEESGRVKLVHESGRWRIVPGP
jgi:hypothetical protein